MPLFHRESPEERQRREAAEAAAKQAAALQERSRQSVEAGGLPIRAQERVAALRAAGDRVPLFSSDLSVDGFLLVRQSGYQPLGLVSGSSVYHIGWNPWTMTGEMGTQTQAVFNAVNLALGRLYQEAQGMGALGVVGTRLEIKQTGWAEDLVEVTALGTALRVPGASPSMEPFISGLSAQEFWSLLRAGTRPSAFVFGNSAYYIYTDWRNRWRNQSWYNQEMELYTSSLYQAQRNALGRMHSQAHQRGAHGIVGVHISHTLRRIEREYEENDQTYTYEDYIVDYISWGTAIMEAPGVIHIDRPATVLDLEDAARTARRTPGSEQGGARPVPVEVKVGDSDE